MLFQIDGFTATLYESSFHNGYRYSRVNSPMEHILGVKGVMYSAHEEK